MAKKTYAEHAEDALYREVWEDVNNEKTERFIKRYSRVIAIVVVTLLILVVGAQLWRRHAADVRTATAVNYETAISNMDANALRATADNSNGAMADLALFQSWLLDKNTATLEQLASDGNTRDFRDLAKIHLAGINGDNMDAKSFEKFMSSLDTRHSPYYYTASLLVAQKYLADGDRTAANEFLDKIIGDDAAPAVIRATAESLR